MPGTQFLDACYLQEQRILLSLVPFYTPGHFYKLSNIHVFMLHDNPTEQFFQYTFKLLMSR